MYDVAITVSACLQAGTRADVGWLVDADGVSVANWSDTVVFTPGGGRIGSLLGGAVDGKLADLAGRWATGRLVELEITPVDALIAELPSHGSVRCLLVPAETLPTDVWQLATDRKSFALVTYLEGDDVVRFEIAEEAEREIAEDRIVSVFSAVPRLIVVGSNPVADALVSLAGNLEWEATAVGELGMVSGHIATLSAIDKVVVTGHDLELAGTALASALESEVGYIGALGSRKMQADRADWLAYRGITDLSRVHGPAGLDIGAETPGEIAVAIVAEAIAEQAGSGRLEGR
jgi:xanthine dehydrogenase accessory factor